MTDLAAEDAQSAQNAENAPDAQGADLASAPVKTTRTRALSALVAVAAAALALDVISKQLVVAHLREGDPVKVLGGLFYLTLIRNGGAAFSMGAGHTYIFPIITVLVVGWIGWMAVKLRSMPWAVSLGLVLGGAFGNLADRLFRAPGLLEGHVVDFISFLSPYGRNFAIFNLADSALTCGVVLAVLLELTGRRRDGTRVRS